MIRWLVALLLAGSLFGADCPADGPLWMVQVRAWNAPTLTPSDFELKVDGKSRPICEVAHAKMPSSIGIVLDVSKSMRPGQLDRRALALQGAHAFLNVAGPQDEFLLVYAGDRSAIALPFTRDRTRLQGALEVPVRAGGTALIDGMCLAVKAMASARHATRAVVVFSDGDDNNSSSSIGEFSSAARSNSTAVFLVAPVINASVYPASEPDIARERIFPAARETGGHVSFVGNAKEVEAATASLSEAIRSPYVLRFAGRPGKVKVDVRSRPRPTLLYRAEPEPSR